MSKSTAKFAGQDLRSRINQIRELKAAGDQLEDSDDISLSSIDTLPLNSPTRTEKRTRSHSETRHRPVSRTSTRSRSPVAKSRSPLRSSEGKSPRRQTKVKTSKHHKRSKEKRSRSKSAKKSKKKSKYKTLNGEAVEAIHPGSVRDCREFYKKYDGIENFEIYGNDRYIYQYISEKYPEDEIKFDISKIKLVTLDIETTSEQGFPDVESCVEEILAITEFTEPFWVHCSCTELIADGNGR